MAYQSMGFREYQAYETNHEGLGIAPVVVTGAIAVGSRLVGGLFGGYTWQEVEHKDEDNLGTIIETCPRAKWFATQMAFAPAEVWEKIHLAAVQANYKHLAKSSFDQDIWHFTYYVFERNCNPERTTFTMGLLKIAEQIETARRESGVVTPAMIELGIVARDGVEIAAEELGLRAPPSVTGQPVGEVVNGVAITPAVPAGPAGPQLAGMMAGMGPMLPWILGAGALLFLLPRKTRSK